MGIPLYLLSQFCILFSFSQKLSVVSHPSLHFSVLLWAQSNVISISTNSFPFIVNSWLFCAVFPSTLHLSTDKRLCHLFVFLGKDNFKTSVRTLHQKERTLLVWIVPLWSVIESILNFITLLQLTTWPQGSPKAQYGDLFFGHTVYTFSMSQIVWSDGLLLPLPCWWCPVLSVIPTCWLFSTFKLNAYLLFHQR